jgi:hypothetical protein
MDIRGCHDIEHDGTLEKDTGNGKYAILLARQQINNFDQCRSAWCCYFEFRLTRGAMTVSIMTLSITTFNTVTLCIEYCYHFVSIC